MSLNLSTASLRSILSLSEKRDALLAELQKVETEISKALGGTVAAKAATLGHETGHGRTAGGSSTKASATRRSVPAKRGKRGAVKELIMAGLKEAGDAGIAVKHLATKIGIKPQNIHVWLHTTGKKSGLVEAAGRGVYRLKQAFGVETPNSIVEVPKPKVARKKKATAAGKGRKSKVPTAK